MDAVLLHPLRHRDDILRSELDRGGDARACHFNLNRAVACRGFERGYSVQWSMEERKRT